MTDLRRSRGSLLAALFLAACARPLTPDPGLLADPGFATLGAAGSPWRPMQHAGSDSYRIGARDGVLRIERHGPEPWGKVVQAIPAASHVGRTLEFSAELRGELAPPGERFVTPSGLVAVVHGAPPGAPAILGETVLGQRLGEPELGAGRHGWTVQRLRIEVPEGASRIELGLILGHEGWIELRHPALRPLP